MDIIEPEELYGVFDNARRTKREEGIPYQGQRI
jgi:hypothetical protein